MSIVSILDIIRILGKCEGKVMEMRVTSCVDIVVEKGEYIPVYSSLLGRGVTIKSELKRNVRCKKIGFSREYLIIY